MKHSLVHMWRTLLLFVLLPVGLLTSCNQKAGLTEQSAVTTSESASDSTAQPSEQPSGQPKTAKMRFASFLVTELNKGNSETDMAAINSLAVTRESSVNYVNSCDGPKDVVFQKLNVKTNKEYITQLHYIYSAQTSEEFQKRSNSGFDVTSVKYGSAKWRENREKINNLYRKITIDANYSASLKEELDLVSTYSRSEDVQKFLDNWLECIRVVNRVPYLDMSFQDSAEVVVIFNFPTHEFLNSNDRVKVRAINSSGNLVLIKGDIANKKINPGNYTLTFKRKNKDKATVSIEMERGFPVMPRFIPKFTNGPTIETRVEKNTLECNMNFDYNAGKLTISDQSGVIQEMLLVKRRYDRTENDGVGEGRGSKKRILDPKVSVVVRTNLKNQNNSIIDCYFTSTRGSMHEFRFKGTRLESDGSLSADLFMNLNVPLDYTNLVTGKLTVVYSTTTQVCVANCPDAT